MNTNKKSPVYTVEEYYNKVKNISYTTELRRGEIVSLASPSIAHQRISRKLLTAIDSYISGNNGKCEVFAAPTDVMLDDSNIVVPDIFVACDPEKFDDRKYNGAPDLIIEIVSSNWADDYCRKLTLYQESGVREYWIVDPKKECVTVFFFEEQFTEHYRFTDSIPVNIYQGKLQITINNT